MSPKDILELGQAISKELKLNDRNSVLEHWLAHHLAEILSDADRFVGKEKVTAEKRAVDLILKLWMHRRVLPEPVDPLRGYSKAIEVLSYLTSDANPWGRYNREESDEDTLREIFEAMCQTVLYGIALSKAARVRQISEAESKALEEEEIFLQSEFERWLPMLAPPRQDPKTIYRIIMQTDEENLENPVGFAADKTEDLNFHQEAEYCDTTARLAIIQKLEKIQSNLERLTNRWKGTLSNAPAADENLSTKTTD